MAAAVVACYRGSPLHPPPPPRPITPTELPGLRSHATTSGVLPTAQPVAVRATVTIANVTSRDTTLQLLGGNCEVLIRIYPRAERTGTPIVDTSGPGVECFGPVLKRTVAAGDSITFYSPRNGPGVPLPPRRYWITALVTFVTPTGSRRLELAAGTFVVPAE